jgi:PAS domain S-box-containing protein
MVLNRKSASPNPLDAELFAATEERNSLQEVAPERLDQRAKESNEALDQIKNRDQNVEQYRERLEHEVLARTSELNKANADLAVANSEMEVFWRSIPSILVGLDGSGHVTRWNPAAASAFGTGETSAVGQHWADCGIQWRQPDMRAEVDRWLVTSQALYQYDNATFEKDNHVRVLGLSVRRMSLAQDAKSGFVITGADVTQRRLLEDQLRQSHKLEAIGQLAAGIAHEINTPTQFVSDNTTFLKDSWDPIAALLNVCWNSIQPETKSHDTPHFAEQLKDLWQKGDLDYLLVEVPKAIHQSLDGLQRIARIVKAMKEFSHPGSDEKAPVDINRAIETTVAVTRNEWKYVADLVLEFDDTLPLVPCVQGEFNQAILNLIVNAAQAIAGTVTEGTGDKGKITITTRRLGESAEISISDTGKGVPEAIRTRIFEPFFTTKPVGKGTGQGLAQVHSTVVKRHKGQLWVESEQGRGATFFVRLPLEVPHNTF